MEIPTARRFADLLTLSRAIIALALVALGLFVGSRGLLAGTWLLMLSWTADALDGPLARRDSDPGQNWVGGLDLAFDVLVSLGLLGFMLVAGYIPWGIAAAYLVVWAAIFLGFGFPRPLAMLVQAPIYAWFILVALQHAPSAGVRLLAWILLITAITWPAFPKRMMPEFLQGMRQLFPRDPHIS